MKSDWETVSLNFVPYKDTGIGIMCSIDDVEVLLDDHIVKTTTMKNSPFIKPFEKDVNEWDFRLVGCYLSSPYDIDEYSGVLVSEYEI